MPPSQDELEKRRQEAVRLEEAGRSPSSSLTWQLVQMVVEVGPSGTARMEAASKIRPMVGGKAPHKEFLKKGLMKRPWKYRRWDR